MRTATRAGAIVAAVILAGAAVCWALGSELIRPVNQAIAPPPGFSAERVAIAGRGHAIAGWWLEAGADAPAVLLLHGVRGSRLDMVARAELLQARGFSVLLIDLQGHGETPGKAITFGSAEAHDAEAAIAWLKARLPGRRIGAIGTSMGGAAILLSRQPTGLDAIVIEAVYPRIGRAVENRLRMRAGPLAPLLTPLLLEQLPMRLHIDPADLAPIRSVGSVGAPLLVVAGSRDQHTTLAESEELYAAATQPKQLWVVDGAGHEDFQAYDPTGYQAHVVGFLKAYLQPAPGAAGGQ
jgi:fermentation-respiration switch protein FrsA (DUF1100 family)